MVDYIVYGLIYPALGLSTTFTEIQWANVPNMLCYIFNWYNMGQAYSGNPYKQAAGLKEPNTYLAANPSATAVPDDTTIGVLFQYTC